MGRLDGKVAFVTGAARGQGRSHAVRLAEEGADVIAIDICAPIDTVPYPLASAEELAVTAKEVSNRGRRVFAQQADVRDDAMLQKVLDAGMAELGTVDIVVANAGIAAVGQNEKRSSWQDVIDVNLTGVFNTVEAALPSMIERGRGGIIVLTSSTAGLTGIGGPTRGGLAYTASKHGVVGLMRNYATNLAPHSIRVNTVHPTGVNTQMVLNDAMQELLTMEPARANGLTNAMPVELLDAVDISNAIVWLASDEARYVTGITLPVDAGFTLKR